jgi:hypothetical protein
LRAAVNPLQGNMPATGYLFLIADGLDDFDAAFEELSGNQN